MIKKTNEYSLKEALDELIENYKLGTKIKELNIINIWDKTVGSLIARHTKKIFLKRTKLFVKIDSPLLKNELIYSRQKLTDRLNKEAKEDVIDEIIFL